MTAAEVTSDSPMDTPDVDMLHVAQDSGIEQEITLKETGGEGLLQEYTMEEVSMHSDSKSCWIVIYDYVYDVTDFLHEVSAELVEN